MSEERPEPQEQEQEQEQEQQQPVAPEPGPEPPPAAAEEKAEEAKPPEPVPIRRDWRDRRIDQLTARLRQAEAREGQQPQPPQEIPTQPESPQARAVLERRAQEIASINEFNKMCNEVAVQGQATYPDFNDRVRELVRLVDMEDQQQAGMYNSFLVAAIETGQGARVIHELGGNLDEAARIMTLTPMRMMAELTRMADKLVQGQQNPPPSSAPRPIRPIGSNRSHSAGITPDDPDRSDGLATQEWMRRREEQIRRRNEDDNRGRR